MKAISVRQPYAWLIVSGYKTVENRTWRTSYRGRLLIHAGRFDFDDTVFESFRRDMAQTGINIPENLKTGGIIGSVNLIDCVTNCQNAIDRDWHVPGMFAFILRDPKRLPFFVMPGKIKIFDIDDSLVVGYGSDGN